MCDADSAELVPIPATFAWSLENFDETHPEYGLNEAGEKCFSIDACIAPALRAVWAAGFKTLGCCCGHGQGYGVISLDLGRTGDVGTVAHHCPLCGQEHVPASVPARSKDNAREWHFIVYADPERALTDDDVDPVLRVFIDALEERGLVCCGGVKPFDMDAEPETEEG